MSAVIDLGAEGSRIDLSRHGIVEAHAGTGKTWTIVNRIAMELLCGSAPGGARLHVRELMLVTYTDKAAGELRGRLRQELEKRLAVETDPGLAAHLEDCLKSLGEAWIGTIHSTALRILRMFPFESGMPLRTEIVDDEEGLSDALSEVLRAEDGPWLSLPEDSRAALSALGLDVLEKDAAALAPHLLDPDADFEFGSADDRRRAREQAEHAALPAWRSLLERIRAELVPSLGSSPKSRKVANLLARWREGLDESVPPRRLEDLSTRAGRPPDLSSDKPDEIPGLQAWSRLRAMWESDYGPCAEALDEAAALDELPPGTALRTEFVRAWAKAAGALWAGRKAAEGRLSYGDMVSRLREGLDDPGLLRALRERIKVGVIDEFQDTARSPWEIFRRWFLDGSPSRILHVVGDPKQSIYSFQGADLGTYFRACGELESAGAVRYVLRRNFRSLPGVVEAVNDVLLGEPPWFLDDRLPYPVDRRASAAERPGRGGFVTESVDSPLRIFEATGKAAEARGEWARAVASDIAARHGSMVRLPEGGAWARERALDWGDFAVVVPARSQARIFSAALEEAGIPWAFYKQEGVFGSRAAREWRALLQCLDEAEEDDARLRVLASTRLFGIPAGSWDPARHRAGTGSPGGAVARWRSLALRGRWSELLRAASLETGWIGRILSGPEADRQWMDHRQVRDWLHGTLRGGAGIRETAARLGRLAEGEEKEGEDRNLFQRATDRRRVQILTMHASKGLEFPVVYLGGGRSVRGAGDGPARWNTSRGLRFRPAFLPAPVEASKQAEAESRRLLYVALTRAQLSCALPVLRDAKGKFHDSLGTSLQGRGADGRGARPWVASVPEGAEPDGPEPPRAGRVVEPDALRRLDLPHRAWRQASFTAVSRNLVSHTLEGRARRSEEGDEESGATGWLPRGARTGDALHEILESLLAPGSDPGWTLERTAPPAPAIERTASILWRHGLAGIDPVRVLDLLARTLRAPLPMPDGRVVRLGAIPARDRRCEVEFLRAAAADGSPALAGAEPAGWVVGHLDLLFRVDGTWYVADWKSNDLPSWDAAGLEAAVREHRYDLQAALYAQAVRNALPGAPFGGCAWIFLRGATDSVVPAWTCAGDAAGDREVDRAVADWRRREEAPWIR